MVIKDCFSGGAILKNPQKLGPILVFETFQSEISLCKLHDMENKWLKSASKFIPINIK